MVRQYVRWRPLRHPQAASKAQIQKVQDSTISFLNSQQRNTWIRVGGVSIYVRKGHHLIDGEIRDTFDIGNINIEPMGTGIGTVVIDMIHDLNPYSITFIENILNPRFYEHLKHAGWLDVKGSSPPSLYKPTESVR